jgi:plasmid stability protein
MPVNLSIKNVPDEVVQGLRGRAVANQRSLNAELLDVLKQAAKDQAPVTIDILLQQAERTKPALDEAAAKVLAAHDAEQETVAQRFEDLLGQPKGEPQSSTRR